MKNLIHSTPGKLKVKSPLLKRDGTADGLKKALSTMHGVAAVDFDQSDGSLLINYNRKTTNHDDIIKLLERKGYY